MFLTALVALPGLALGEELIEVPSGQPVHRYEIILENKPELQEDWLILRFIAPDIARQGGVISYEDASPDLDFLCETVGLKVAKDMGEVDQIMVSLLDQKLPRGAMNSGVTQFMSAYRVVEGKCEWE